MMRHASHRLRTLVALLLGSVLLTGCDFDVYSLPLPGGADSGEDPIEVTVQFADVLDLVPQSSVKVNDLSVGKVTDVDLDGYTAEVTLELRRDTGLPDNALASIRQTSLLGEKFVSLEAPPTGASPNPLTDGDVIPLERSGRNPEVEEVLGALSLVLNGGGVAQLKTITQELNLALEGREDSARSVLRQVEQLTRTLDDNKGDIVRAIESLNRLSLAVREQQPTIDAALEELPSALTSIDRQRDDLIRMLQSLDRLSGVGVRVIRQSKASTIASVKHLQPILRELADSGENLANSLHVVLTYPFVDDVVGRDPQVARNLHMGDYVNLSVNLQVDLTELVPTGPDDIVPSAIDPTNVVNNVLACLASGNLASEACQKVLNTPRLLLQLREECRKPANRTKTVCAVLNQVPGLPGGHVPQPSGLPTLPLPLESLLTGGLLRAEPAWAARGGTTRPTVGELQQVYDPALVQLLVPGMATREVAQ